MLTREIAEALMTQAVNSELGIKFKCDNPLQFKSELYRIRKEIGDPRYENLQVTHVSANEVFIVKPGGQL